MLKWHIHIAQFSNNKSVEKRLQSVFKQMLQCGEASYEIEITSLQQICVVGVYILQVA